MPIPKKIATLTMPLYVNYGGILQAYALQTFLKRIGYDAYLINIQLKRHFLLKEMLNVIKRIALQYIFNKKVGFIFDSAYTTKSRAIISQNTTLFINKYIQFTTCKIFGIEKLTNNVINGFDAYIVGSDQIWRPKYCNIVNYFLGFLPENDNVKRIAYAASFGVDEWEFNNKETETCAELAKLFNAISVREDSGVKLCKAHLGVVAIHLIDPTMLIYVEDYKKLSKTSLSIHSNEGELLVYILDQHSNTENAIDKISKAFNYRPFQTNNPKTEVSSASAKERIAPSVESWLNGYNNAKYVITDSFHGTVFSILFNIPFIVYGNQKRGMARFTSLLRMFGLEDRMIYSNSELSEDEIFAPIDWKRVNEILRVEREKSLHFIKDSLS